MDKPWRHRLGQKIRSYRIKKGLTLQQAADAYGIARQNWSRFEAGQNMGVDSLVKVAKLLGVEAWRLLKR